MGLIFAASREPTKDHILEITDIYFDQKSIGNWAGARKILQVLKALHVYIFILDYYYEGTIEEEGLTEEDIKHVYNKFKKAIFSIKPIIYD